MNIHILDLSLEIIQESAEIRNNEGLLTNDSLMLATMKKYNIGKLITNDAACQHKCQIFPLDKWLFS